MRCRAASCSSTRLPRARRSCSGSAANGRVVDHRDRQSGAEVSDGVPGVLLAGVRVPPDVDLDKDGRVLDLGGVRLRQRAGEGSITASAAGCRSSAPCSTTPATAWARNPANQAPTDRSPAARSSTTVTILGRAPDPALSELINRRNPLGSRLRRSEAQTLIHARRRLREAARSAAHDISASPTRSGSSSANLLSASS